MNQAVTCCCGCTDRHEGCHGTCERYREERERFYAIKAEKRKYLEAEDFYWKSIRRQAAETRRHRRRK